MPMAPLLRLRVLLLVCCGMLLWSAPSALAQTQRALLVGIDQYVPEGTRGTARGWSNLDGAENDVRLMQALLTARFGFPEDNVSLLLNTDATRQGILDAIRARLIEPSQSGDHVYFHYSGHGSQVVNRGSTEADSLDESIVPADAHAGVQDIRDKELRRLFNELLDKGVTLTLIFDSCHSGSVTRGIAPGKSRALRTSPVVVNDPSGPVPPPQSRPGALVISSAQDSEKAKEMTDDTGQKHGAFTWSLARVLREAPAGLPSRLVFARVRALMRSHGFTQEPVLEGEATRRNRPLFGGDAQESYTGTTVAVLDAQGPQEVTLQGGLALGLRPGTELRKLYDEDAAPSDSTQHVRLRITAVNGLAQSVAEVVQGAPADVTGGDLMLVDRWVAAAGAPLRLWLPPSMPTASVQQAQPAMQALRQSSGWTWVTDPTQTPPTHVVAWTGSRWTLRQPDGSTTDLGASLDAAAVSDAMQPVENATLFASLPPTDAVAEALREKLDALPQPVEVSGTPGDAVYHLAGTFQRGAPGYFWVYRPATNEPTAAAPPRITRVQSATSVDIATSVLADYVRRIDRVWGWLQMESPPDGFPYRIGGFQNVRTGERLGLTDSLRWREAYQLVLTADPGALRAAQRSFDAGLTKRYLYVFAIDIEGNGTLLFGSGNIENTIDFFDDVEDPQDVLLPRGNGSLFESFPTRRGQLPYEVDTFVLVTTSEPLPSPEDLLTFSGVASRDKGPGMPSSNSPLARALYDVAQGTRGTAPPVPTDWSIQRVPMIATR